MLDSIEQAVRPHDKYQVEVKLDYELQGGKKTRYEISTYIFVPRTLGIMPHTYSKQDFYRDIQNYIRLKTPQLILRDFLDHSSSPFVTIEEILSSEDWSQDTRQVRRMVRSLKLLAAMLKTSIREHLNLIYRRIDEAEPDAKLHHLINSLIEEYVVETRKIIEHYRGFLPVFNLPNVDEQVFLAYTFTDESISLLIEENAVELYEVVEKYVGKKSDREAFRNSLLKVVQSETRHRKSRGYVSILRVGENWDNEEYETRTSQLKKYTSSVLYLSTQRRTEGRGLREVLFALAAGISMLFATLLAFYFQQRMGNFTLPLLVALVIGYMFKDRLKEIGRGVFSAYLQNHMYDHRIIIRAPGSRAKLGVLKEKMTFVSEAQVPKGVMRRRLSDQTARLESDVPNVFIILHSKEITLYNDAFKYLLTGDIEIPGINDITRYDIHSYLRKMDDSVQRRIYLDEGGVKAVDCHKVYQVDLMSKYRSMEPDKDRIYSRIRLVLQREGIKRVEHLPV